MSEAISSPAGNVFEGILGLLRDPPGRSIVPFGEFLFGPLIRLAGMARGAWIRDAGLLSLLWRDEAKGVRRDIVIFDGLFDTRHVAGNALAACTAGGVMSVLTDSAMQAGGILTGVATEAERISAYGKSGDGAAVHLVAIEAADLAVIHVALHKIVALHAVLVRSEIGELVEVGDARPGLFELPVVG